MIRNLSTANLSMTIVGTGISSFALTALIDASFKSLFLLGGVWLLCLLLKTSAAIRHLIWSVSLVGLIAMPIIVMSVPQWKILPNWLTISREVAVKDDSEPVSAPERATRVPESLDEEPVFTPNLTREAEVEFAEPLSRPGPTAGALVPADTAEDFEGSSLRLSADFLMWIWGVGAIALLVPPAVSMIRLKQVERKCRHVDRTDPAGRQLSEKVRSLCAKLKIKAPQILIGGGDVMPMVWSLPGRRMLLPNSYETWSASRLTAVLMHELAHLKRRDPVLFLLSQIARAVHWFNPLVWYAHHRLRVECEAACDDFVLESGTQPAEYASHLLDLSTSLVPIVSDKTAFAMSSKPQVESRIESILNEKINRRGVTMKRALFMLTLAIAAVSLLASISAVGEAVSGEPPQAIDRDHEKPEIKWPHCELNLSDLQPRSLATAIEAFNRESKSSPIGSTQQPIADKEVLAAIDRSLKDQNMQAPIRAILKKIQAEKILPANAYFRRFTRLDDGSLFHGVWWVRLIVTTKEGRNHFVDVRSKTIFTRPLTQMERRQNKAQGPTLINRISSYFAEIPQVTEVKVPRDQVDRLRSQFGLCLKNRDIEALKKLCVWAGTDQATQQFVANEFKALCQAKIESVDFESQRLQGNLITWSAYQQYQPNLPVVGFLKVKVAADQKANFAGTTLYLELGLSNKQLRLVNYVADGKRNLPKRLPQGLSTTGHNAVQGDGRLVMTTLTSNPGSLISAHLANEEVWVRDLSAKTNIHVLLSSQTTPGDHSKLKLMQGQPDLPSSTRVKIGPPVAKLDDESIYSDERIVSRRLDELFEKLKVEPRLRKSSLAKDLPELYQKRGGQEATYTKRDGVLVLRYNPGVKYHDKMEHIWLQYIPSSRMYFVEHRFQLDDPHHDHVFGPYRGNPLERLPEIEREILREIRDRNSPPAVLGRMMRVRDFDLTQRVISVVDQALDFDLRIPKKNMVYKAMRQLLDVDWKKWDPMRSLSGDLDKIQERFEKFDQHVESLKLKIPDSSYAVKGIPFKQAVNESQWGPAQKGLRFAALLSSKKWVKNETVTVTFLFKNVSEQEIKFSVRDFVQQTRPQVQIGGQPISTFSTWFSGWPPTMRYRIKPGQVMAVGASKLTIFPAGESKKTQRPGLTQIPITKSQRESGRPIQISYSPSIGTMEAWTSNKDGNWRVSSPAQGEWQGRLHSAAIEVQLK